MSSSGAIADSLAGSIASYYARHMALVDGTAFDWSDGGPARRLLARIRQVGVGRDTGFALRDDGELIGWTDSPGTAVALMRNVWRFAAGASGWFAIDHEHGLWHAADLRAKPTLVARGVATACIGDGADYYAGDDGSLYVKGLAHRGQYGDGRLTESPVFVATARDVIAVEAHTGHAIHLRRDGVVMGTGGNRFGPLSSHGLGDKADRWGPIFDGAATIATGARHSAAIRTDGTLWAWGEGFDIAPRKLLDGVIAVAAGETATIARTGDGRLWQWERGVGPRRVTVGA